MTPEAPQTSLVTTLLQFHEPIKAFPCLVLSFLQIYYDSQVALKDTLSPSCRMSVVEGKEVGTSLPLCLHLSHRGFFLAVFPAPSQPWRV